MKNGNGPVASDVAAEDLAKEVREKAVEVAAQMLANRILDRIEKDAEVRQMRRESIARARDVLATKRSAEAESTKAEPELATTVTAMTSSPAVVTEVRRLARPPIIRKGRKVEHIHPRADPHPAVP